MFTGSMCGAGAIVYAVFTYAIVNARPDCGSTVSLSPIALSGILGESSQDIEKAINELCRPDKESRSTIEEGRRLVRIGMSMDYRVVNLEKYRFLDNGDQKQYWRDQKREQRGKSSRKPVTIKGCPGHVPDKLGQIGKCPHADADADAGTIRNKDKGVVFPDCLNTPQFKEAWDEWGTYRKEIKKKLTPTSIKKQLKFLEGWGHDAAIRVINRSIANTWQGLFEPQQQSDLILVHQSETEKQREARILRESIR